MLKPVFSYLLTFIAGLSLTLAYAPFSLWFVSFIALTTVFYVYQSQPQLTAWKLGMAFGIGWFGAGISWVHVSIANFGGLPLVGSIGLMALLIGYLSVYPALAFHFAKKHLSGWLTPLGFAAIWFLTEWIRSWFLTGFPWLSLGYSQNNGPFNSLYPIIGETGVTFLLVLVSFSTARLLLSAQYKTGTPLVWLKTAGPMVFMLLAALFFQQVRFSKATDTSVSMAMVQGNIKQELRWVPEQDKPTMDKYLALTDSLWNKQIVLWPEAAIPKLEPLAQDYLKQLDKTAYDTDTGLITGIVNYNFETNDAYNNLIVLGKVQDAQDGPMYRYFHHNRFSKHHLLPIGEFIPMEDWLRGLAPIFDLPMSSFTRGDYEQQNLLVNGYRFLPAICFEIAFSRQMAANLRQHSDFLVTVSNDAWFGDSHGPAQHLEIAQVRAAEFGLPLLRATNNGITAFVDHEGHIISSAPQFQEATLSANIQLTSGITPYRYWGDVPLWLLSLISLIMIRRSNPVIDQQLEQQL